MAKKAMRDGWDLLLTAHGPALTTTTSQKIQSKKVLTIQYETLSPRFQCMEMPYRSLHPKFPWVRVSKADHGHFA